MANNFILSESSRLIFEAMMVEAESRYERMKRHGVEPNAAIEEVAQDMALNDYELNEFVERVKKRESEPAPKSGLSEVADDTEAQPLSIVFESQEEANEALQHLMDRGIAWSNQSQGSRPCIQFAEQAQLNQAQNSLRRKWDFVENRKRLVADVQFDNLGDYQRVLEFMHRQGMLLEFNRDIELDEDYDEIQNQHEVQRKLAQKEGRIFEDRAPEQLSFVAKSRSATAGRVDPVKESQFRSAVVRRRWK